MITAWGYPYSGRVLVLTRRVGESIVVGDDVVVTVLEVKGDGIVRLGIDAPRSVRVHRAEVHAAVMQANREAASASRSSVEELRSLTSRAGAARPTSGPGTS